MDKKLYDLMDWAAVEEVVYSESADPFAVLGFLKYNGMTAEKFIWAWIKSEFLTPKVLIDKPKNLYYEMCKENIENHQKEGLKNHAENL